MLERDDVKKDEEFSEESGVSCESKSAKPTFIDTFKASLIDLIVIGALSTVGLFVINGLLELAGYAITQKFQMSFIIFMVVMVFYMSIMESRKTSATIGKKISGLIISKR